MAGENTAPTSAHQEYVDDQLQRESTVAQHVAVLKQRAPERIAAMKSARKAQGLPEDTAGDADTNGHFHVVEDMLDQRAYYPPHDKRTESPAYHTSHDYLVKTLGLPCLACGVTYATLGDVTKNPFGAVQLETHHHVVEWALANAVDPVKFNAHVVPGLNRRAQAMKRANAVENEFDAAYAAGMTPDQIVQWVDHAVDNLWVLCDVHHRHKFVGIHAVTYPIWGPQDIVSDALLANLLTDIKSTTDKAAKGATTAAAG